MSTLAHGTASGEIVPRIHVDGGYVEFQQTVMRAIPRDIDAHVADWWRNNGRVLAGALRELLLTPNRPTAGADQRTQLIVPFGTAIVIPTAIPFVARDHFVMNDKSNRLVKIAYIWDNFGDRFLDKVEQPFAGSTLKFGRLYRSSVDWQIIAELGGEEKAESTLTEAFSLMLVQGNGEPGPLLTNGFTNIFYVRDVGMVLRSISLRWMIYGWSITASSARDPNEWNCGNQVFSRSVA